MANVAKKTGKGKGGKTLTIRPEMELKALIEALASLEGLSVNEYTIRLYKKAVSAEDVRLIDEMKRRHAAPKTEDVPSPKVQQGRQPVKQDAHE